MNQTNCLICGKKRGAADKETDWAQHIVLCKNKRKKLNNSNTSNIKKCLLTAAIETKNTSAKKGQEKITDQNLKDCLNATPDTAQKITIDHNLEATTSDFTSDKDNLNNDILDRTWGGQRSLYMYNCIVEEIPDLSGNDDSDQAESVLSVQSKSTVELMSDLSSEQSSCRSGCMACRDSNHTEYEVASSSSPSSDNFMSDFISYSSSVEDYKVSKKIDNELADSSDRYFPEDTDGIPETSLDLLPPFCFKNCLQCRKENDNPYFQFCFSCYKKRRQFFPERKNKKLSNGSNDKKKLKDSDTQKEASKRLENTQKEASKRLENTKKDVNDSVKKIKNIKNICNICLGAPKNGVINHKKIGHIFSCYPCAKQIWRTSKKCPICNQKIQYVTKMITV
ncbi:Zinc finger, RING-type,Zinc finger, RING/FYVE/PHD-type [Cinara cedri]|uniref:Zinc finger, RING-type,Zinc finger, RING/FYVE/PHD-type n=1 Tax=Cinara cedri TaxID=506608 RepID=A0A5E4M1H0_9HEMI|nr:Zinc finger, RING-type,Zinc finger, RING/FYVE/PHD-type [Cinara cedri]